MNSNSTHKTPDHVAGPVEVSRVASALMDGPIASQAK